MHSFHFPPLSQIKNSQTNTSRLYRKAASASSTKSSNRKNPGGAEAKPKLARKQADIEKRVGIEIGNEQRHKLKLKRLARRMGKQEDKKNKENENEIEGEGTEFDNTDGV
jgi:hypothetical protein